MRQETFEARCDICGGKGCGTMKTLAAQWTQGIRHSNPNVCIRNLKRKLEKDNV